MRISQHEVANLLADDFIEFGSSGRVYRKQQVIDALQHEDSSAKISIDNFNIVELSDSAVLVINFSSRNP